MDATVFVPNVKNRCRTKGVAPTVACVEAGLGNSFIANIKKGQTPSVTNVQKLSTYLGCTVSDLLGEAPPGQKEPTPVTESGPRDSLEAQLMNLIGQLSPDSKKMLIAQLEVLLRSQSP